MAILPVTTLRHTPLGVFGGANTVFLFYKAEENGQHVFQIDASSDGLNFTVCHDAPKITDKKRVQIDIDKCDGFHVTQIGKQYFLTFKYRIKNQMFLFGALSDDLVRWRSVGKLSSLQEQGVVVPNYKYQDAYVLYYGEHNLSVATSKDFANWDLNAAPVLEAEKDFFGSWPLQIANAGLTDNGIVVTYFVHKNEDGHDRFVIQQALFDKNNPKKLLQKMDAPLWESSDEWTDEHVEPLGIVLLGATYVTYWKSESRGMFAIFLPITNNALGQKRNIPNVILNKIKENPIMKPIVEHFWESKAVFNPAAVFEQGKVHLVYRAIGDHDVSTLGYAASDDGIHFDQRLSEPIYVPTQPFESNNPYTHAPPTSAPYASGGGCFGGCEDPRITKVDDKYVMTYVAYDGWNPPRVAMTSIKVEDFLKHNWNWEKPVLITEPGVVNKNACVLPEKINGKYVMFHRVFPDILVDYIDDLNFDGESKWLRGEYRIKPRKTSWDSRKIGIGAPPIKTDAGWLLIYQSVGNQDPGRYKMGAMLLDLKDPTKVLHRSNTAILEPNEWYENEGYKSGVAYPCGAVAFNNKLHVYYGGADTVVCVATAPMDDFLGKLQSNENAELVPLGARQVLS
jgi:beta-1,2-mannobiose phosphorylase / 1,2-beta-oligomannan phosphorylase